MNTDKAELFASYWRMLAPAGLPRLEPEHKFATAWKRQHRFDFAFIDEKIAVEVDGGQFAYKGGRHAGDKDREKMNIAAALGWRVFHFSPKMLEADPEACISLVVEAVGGGR